MSLSYFSFCLFYHFLNELSNFARIGFWDFISVNHPTNINLTMLGNRLFDFPNEEFSQ